MARHPSNGATVPAIACGVTAALGWSVSGPLIRWAGAESAAAITLARLAVGLAVALGSLAVPRVRLRVRLDLANPATHVLGGFLVGYYVLSTAAFQIAPVAEVALLVGMAPAVAVLLDRCRGRVASGMTQFGVVLAIAGLALVMVPNWVRGAPGAQFGGLLAVGAAGCKASYAVAARSRIRGVKGIAPWSANVAAYGGGTLILACWIPWTEGDLDAAVPASLVALVLLGLAGTVLPTLSYGIAAARLSPPLATALTLLSPLMAAFWGVVALGEWPSLWLWCGAPLVLAGLGYLTTAEVR